MNVEEKKRYFELYFQLLEFIAYLITIGEKLLLVLFGHRVAQRIRANRVAKLDDCFHNRIDIDIGRVGVGLRSSFSRAESDAEQVESRLYIVGHTHDASVMTIGHR